jgi:hypothetical protein
MSILDDAWTTVNWLAITFPFILAYSGFQYGEGKKLSKPVSYFFAAIIFVLMAGLYYFVYPLLGFPAWMRWFVA